MQTTQPISVDQLHQVVAAVFAQGPVVVKQAYSDFDTTTREFLDVKALTEDLRRRPGKSDVFRNYTVYYPEAKGRIYERRIALKPESCDGHTFRFCQEGWGLIQLQCDFR